MMRATCPGTWQSPRDGVARQRSVGVCGGAAQPQAVFGESRYTDGRLLLLD